MSKVRAWAAMAPGQRRGCEVTALTSSAARIKEAKALGAHNVVSSTDPEAIAQSAKSLDPVIVTVNVPLDWSAVISTLAPHGRLHFVGAVLDADFKP